MPPQTRTPQTTNRPQGGGSSAAREKVEFFEKLGLPRRLISAPEFTTVWSANQKRYFALKLPLAVDPETVSFAYVDPGHQTDRELHSWGAAHGPLWDALRTKGRQVRVIGIAVEKCHRGSGGRECLKHGWRRSQGTPDQGTHGEAGNQGDSRGDDSKGTGEFSSAIWRLWGSHATLGGAATSPRSQGHRRSLD